MTWISGGNLIVDGKAVMRRNIAGEYWMGGEAFDRRFRADNMHLTPSMDMQNEPLAAGRVIRGSENMGGEATLDARPSDKMYEIVAGVIERNRDNDFAYYYISDEPECRYVSPVYLKYIYDFIKELDPYHVVMIATRAADVFVDSADWFETHPYINPCTDKNGKRVYIRPISSVGKFVDDIVNLNRPDKCIGLCTTCFAGLPGRKDPYPTFEEYICHTWVGLLHGSKTLMPYAYHDINDRASIYEGARYVFASVEALEDLLLHGKRTILQRDDKINAVLFELGDEKMFALCNMTNDPQQVTLDGISGTWYGFRMNSQITGNTFALKPLEVLIGTTAVKDEGLSTFDEALAVVEKAESERKQNRSLLFERFDDLEISQYPSALSIWETTWNRRLFDGVRDNYAWMNKIPGEKYLELNLTKVQPHFNKVLISGYNVADMEIWVRNNGELSMPEIVEVKTEEFSTTFLLKDRICPDALRLVFKAEKVELYEIEVF